MLPYIDLHVHSSMSLDGCTPVSDIPAIAKEQMVGVISITDHNHLTDVEPLRNAHPDMIFIQGAELSSCFTDSNGLQHEVHVGGHNLPLDNFWLNEVIKKKDNFDHEGYIREILYKLKCRGIDISFSEVLEYCSVDQLPSRSCVAKAMMARGYGSFGEIYDRWLGERGEKLAFVSKASQYAQLEEVVSAIMCSGGTPILNHILFCRLGDEENRRLCRIFKDMTGDKGGIETAYAGFSSYGQAIVHSYAEKYNLLRSCGSDYHGRDDRTSMGFPRSSCDEQLLELLLIPPL